MKVFKQLMSLLFVLIIICGAFSAVPFAAETEDTAFDPEEGSLAATGASALTRPVRTVSQSRWYPRKSTIPLR